MNESTSRERQDDGAALHIVGAGPAGLACAIVLARGGRSVVVHDRRKQSGARFHNDFQGLENWTGPADILTELAKEGIAPTFDYVPATKGVAFDVAGKAYPIESKKPLYYLVRRGAAPGTLDQGLLEQAGALGIDIRFDDRIDEIEGPAVLAIGPRTADAIAAGYVFETDMADGNWICFNEALAPKGYAYLLVAGGRGTVASCMFTHFKDQRQHVERTLDFFRKRVGLNMKNKKIFGGYGNFRFPRSGVQGGKLVIGEQAGFQDSLAGFGMSYALRSGILAARSLLEGRDYTALWRRSLAPLLRTSISNRFLFNIVGERGRAWALSRHIAKGDARRALGQLYRPWWLSRLVYPLARWRYRAPLRDKSCNHVNCACVWCEHGVQMACPATDCLGA